MCVASNGMAAYTYPKEEYDGVTPSPQKADHENQRHDCTSDSIKPVWYSRALSSYEEQNPNLSTFSYGSLEAYGGDEINQSVNIFEELEELRCQRQKLTETNEALHRRLETTEESRTELLNKAEEAKETISSLLQKQSVFKDQMRELRDEIKCLENNSLCWQNQVAELESEKQSLGKIVRLLKSEDTEKLSLRRAVASLEDELENARIEIDSKDIKLKEVVKHRDELIDELLEENKNYIELYKSHKDLQTAFQAMKIEKRDLEKSEIRPMRSSVGEELIDKNENLLSELRIVVNESPGPSPICGLVSYEKTSGEIMEGLRTMVESVSAEMERLDITQADQEPVEQNLNELRAQHDSLLCKMKWIMEAKKHSDQRAVSMGDKLKALREENAGMKAQLQGLKEDVTEHTDATTFNTPGDDTDHRLSQAENELVLARAEVELMEFTSGRDKQRIIDLESLLSILQKDLELKRFELTYETSSFEEELIYRTKRQHAKKKPVSADSIGVILDKAGNTEPRRPRCSHCKREGVVRNKRISPESIPFKPDQAELEECVQKLQDLSHLDDTSSDEDVPDCESIEPLLESGYRTEASIGRSPVPSKHQLFPQSFPISTVVDALALDAFPQSFHPIPSLDRATFLSRSSALLPLCPRCGYHLDPSQHQVFSSTEILYPKLFGAFDPIGLLTGDATSIAELSDTLDDLFKNEVVKPSLQDCGTQTETAEDHCKESQRLPCHACVQTDLEVRIRKIAGTQTEEDAACLLNKSSEVTHQGSSTCSQGVSASVVLTETQSQTDNAEESCDTVLVDNAVEASLAKVSLTGNSSTQTDCISNEDSSVEVTSIATQTLPNPNPATSASSFTFDLTIPVPSNDHLALVKTSSVSSTYLAPSTLPPHLISEDWDSDISSDSPLFVSARSSPLVFGKQEGEPPKPVETLSFKPIGASREKMEQTVPACLDENSNKDIARHKPSVHRETVLNPEKSTMRQRRSLERERKYSGVVQASNGEMVDLTTAEIDASSITPSDHALNEKLLSESRKVTEKFENRRGRRFSPAKNEADDVVSDDTSPDSSPEPMKGDMSPCLITQEERVGAEGDSDPEEENAKSRKVSDEFDIKADLMKAIGPIKTDSTPKSALSSSKIRQEKKAKRPVFKLHSPMPELSEETCEDSCSLPNGTLETLETVLESNTDTCKAEVPTQCSVKQEGEVKWDAGEGETKQRKSSILSETFLKTLGLKKGEGDKTAVLTDQEVEEKYSALTFAFKTDRLTLEQRYKIQQHQRNVIENYLKEEIRDHAAVVRSLEQRCAEDEIARTDINKLKQHIDVIQYALVKLASKAEGFGAVQQEDRLSRASDVMVTHVENIKRSLENEKKELSEAKRVLHENKILLRGNTMTGDDSDSGGRLRRASTLTNPAMKHSLHGIVRQKLMRKNSSDLNDPDESKRRASVAAVLGFGNSPLGASSLAKNHNRAQSVPVAITRKTIQFFQGDGRNRFASLANAALIDRSLTSPVGGRGALETCKEGESEKRDIPRFSEINKKKLSISLSGGNHSPELAQLSPIKPLTPPASSPTDKSPRLVSSTPVVISGDGEGKNNSQRSKTEEEIFQQGFEQGVRSQISQELDDLRDQQRALCENLEEIMEAAEDEDEDEHEKNGETQPIMKLMRQYSKTIPWSRASRIGRLILTGTLFILAIISIIGTILPLEKCSGGGSLLSAPWEEVVRVLGPYTNIYHPSPPPI
eukprot:XP_011682301.1 PREDICTED: uncharacterized protein LOC100891373 isoform X3 [Strongylocentrotus purpuratus]